jgi:hypothetical protein
MMTLTSLSESVTFVIWNRRTFGMICAVLVFLTNYVPTEGRSAKLSVGTLCAIFPMRDITLKGSAQMKRLTTSLIIGACLLLPSAGAVFAENPHGAAAGLGVTKGQPGTQPSGAPGGASCGTLTGGAPPGQLGAGGLSSNSPFALDAVGLQKNYAGTPTNPGNSASNAHANSQYDVACFQHSTTMP